jgi:hypothetical protein
MNGYYALVLHMALIATAATQQPHVTTPAKWDLLVEGLAPHLCHRHNPQHLAHDRVWLDHLELVIQLQTATEDICVHQLDLKAASNNMLQMGGDTSRACCVGNMRGKP